MIQSFTLNNSHGVIGLFLGVKSRITPYLPLLVTLVMLTLGGWNSVVRGETASSNYTYKNEKNKDVEVSLKNNRTWPGTHVSFTLSGDNGNGVANCVGVRANQIVTIDWSVDPGYTIEVTKLKLWIGHNGVGFFTSYKCDIYVNNSKVGTYGTIINEGKEYDGYSLGNDANFTFYPSRNIDLYQVEITYNITPNNYTVTLNNHEATTAGTTSVSVTYDATTGISSNITVPTKTDYTFGGYYTGENGTGALRINTSGAWQAASGFIEDGKWKNAGDVELHAYWILNSKTITLDNQLATTAGTESLTVFYNKNTNLTGTPAITIPAKTNHTFEGYYTEAAGSGVPIIDREGNVNASVAGYTDGDKKWLKETDVTLYAYWKQNQTISWTQDFGSPVRSNVITLSASASSSLGITYEVTVGSDLVTLSGSTLTCKKAGSVTVTAHQSGNHDWNAADASKSFTIIEHAITTNPTASGELTYEQTLNSISPTGGVTNVAGSWAWKYPSSVPGAGTANQVAVFTPSSSVISAYPLECNVSVTVNKANPDVTCTVNANTHYVDDTKIDLQSTWTREGNGAITYSVLSFEESGENNEDGTTPYVESNRYLHLQKAGTAQVKMAIAEGTNYIARNETINVVINKRTPVFTWDGDVETNFTFNYFYNTTKENIFFTTGECAYTLISNNEYAANVIDNTLHIYNVKETATITATQVENYKWNGKEVEYVITPVNQNNHVPFTVTGANKGTFVTVAEDDAEWNGDNGYKMGAGKIIMDNAPYSYIIIQFVGIPDKLTFRATCDKVGIGAASSYPIGNNYYFDVYESEDGSFGDTPIWSNPNRGTKYSEIGEQNYTVQLAPTTRYVKLRYHGTCYGHFRNIHISELHKFTSNPKETLDFGTEGLNYGEQTELVAFNHANAGRITSAEITGEDANYFRVAPSTIAGTGRDLYGTAYLAVTFDNVYNEERRNKGDNAYNATLTIRDNDSTHVIALTGKRFGKSYPKFTFNPNHLPYYYGATIANIASSSNTDYANCPLSFETTDSQIAYVDEDGRLHIGAKEGSVTITVRQNKGNADYYSGSATFTFTPRTRPDLAVPYFVNRAKYDEGILTPGKDADMTWNSDPNNEIRLGDGWVLPTSWGVKSFVVEFAGTPDKVSFQYKTNKTTTSSQFGDGDILKAPIWTVEESSNGSDWTRVWRDVNNSNSYASSVTECLLKENTRYLRFSYNGNGYGYFKNIKVTELVGYKYLRASDGEYLSRGGKWATQAVTDAFGIPCRLMNETEDNEHSYTRFEYADSKECLYETDAEIFTDNKTANSQNALWYVDYVDGTLLRLRSANTAFGKQGYYVTNSEGAMALTSNAEAATLWVMEDYTEHGPYMASIFDAEAAAAAREEFGSDVNTRAKVHNCLTTEDFEKEVISIETVSPAQRSAESEFRNGVSGARDVYDFVKTGLTPGFYILSVKALFRIANSETAWENHQRGTESVVAYAYANNVKYPIQSVYASYQNPQIEGSDERHDVLGEPHYYSTTLSSATTAFGDLNRYNNDIYVLVGEDGRLEYGMKCPSYVPGAWLAYAGVTLTRVARKQYIFNGSVDDEWTTDGSWNRGSQPNIHHEVIIDYDVIIESEIAAYSVTINEGKTVTIAPNGGLTIGAGGVRGASAEKLILKAGTAEDGALKGKTGYLRISPYSTQPMPEATVELCVTAYYNASVSGHQDVGTWQYIGSPMVGGAAAKTVFRACMLYDWSETTGTWKNNLRRLVLQPFTGYASSQYNENGTIVSNTGQLVSNSTVVLPLTYTEESATPGCNVFANSFAAPIDITRLSASDFSEGVEASIHMFNTGSRADIERISETKSFDVNAAGQYLSIPVATASKLGEEFGYPTIIPAMQGFYVNTDRAGSLTLNYERLVWNADLGENPNAPLRVKQRMEEEQPITGSLMLTMYTTGLSDNVYILKSETYNATFENGYDASKKMSGACNIFTVEDEHHLSVDATNSIIGTRVGVRTGDETAYTLLFTHLNSIEELALIDVETDELIDINEGTEYTFFAEPNAMITERFEIVARADAPAITTGVDNVENGAKVHKFIKDNQLFILKNGVLYNATGAVVR